MFFIRSHKLIFLIFSLIIIAFGCTNESEDLSGISSGSITTPPSNESQSSRTVSFCDTSEPDRATMNSLAEQFNSFRIKNGEMLREAQMRSTKKVNIPVIFHVISKGPSFEEGEVDDDTLIEQIDILNRAYSGETGGISTPFQFTLSGINRVRNSKWHALSPSSPTEIDVKTNLKVGGPETMNVYVADIVLEDQEGTILGYSSLPVFYKILSDQDGIVLNFRAVPGGPLKNYNLGNTLVHEAGHWLGLLHTFNGGCEGAFTDFVSDTPRHELPTEPCPSKGYDSCTNAIGNDPSHNHMNYTVDSCRYEFTAGQINFMKFNTFLFRGLSTF